MEGVSQRLCNAEMVAFHGLLTQRVSTNCCTTSRERPSPSRSWSRGHCYTTWAIVFPLSSQRVTEFISPGTRRGILANQKMNRRTSLGKARKKHRGKRSVSSRGGKWTVAPLAWRSPKQLRVISVSGWMYDGSLSHLAHLVPHRLAALHAKRFVKVWFSVWVCKGFTGLCQISFLCLLCFVMERVRCCYRREDTASLLIASGSRGSFSLNSWWLPNEQRKLKDLNKTGFSGY